jgi:hypothetical protein
MPRSAYVLLASALVLASCATSTEPLPTLVPSLTPAPEQTLVSTEIPPTASQSAPVVVSPSAVNTMAATATASSTVVTTLAPTRRVSATPVPSLTLTEVATTTPFPTQAPARLSPTATLLAGLAETLLPITPSPTKELGLAGGALAAYASADALASTEHPQMRLFFISGNPASGWTVGYRDPRDANQQALYQVNQDASVIKLDVLSPQASESFDPADVQVDSTALLPLVADFASARETLIYTLTRVDGSLVWEVRNLEQNASRLYDALTGEQLP